MTMESVEEQPIVAARLPDVPFDAARLDGLLDDAGLDAVLVTSKHNIQYMLGGYRYFFYANMDAHGLSRYLPCLVYVKGRSREATYIASPMEDHERELGKFWVDSTHFNNMTSRQTAATAVSTLRHCAPRARRIGIETSFLPVDAYEVLRDGLPGVSLESATLPLELLRAVKTQAELTKLEDASTKVVEAMLAVIGQHGKGATKANIAEALRYEETVRGVTFDYCLITMGQSFNRAPSGQAWREGEVLSLDSGGNIGGYIGDLCRMAILGEPDAELEDLLAEINAIQMAARGPVLAGARGGDVFAAPEAMLARSPHRERLDFVAHGMGIVSHEAPWLTGRSAVPYEAYHANRPLEAGMVLSIETTLLHPRRGFIKLEDTVAVTETGWTAFGDAGRGWNSVGG
ncbi:M24 family metallopeptidase [Lichenihabitans psoromatis]|uniref:M24 family metallopeptidase n=1 Tax=Lichenihabitans psoromatis TaxID=2528642 RepID=UPI001FE0C3A2|nr:Xaa-Pro peptidase family protein [Lichenihabitans psoromatis]